MDHELIGKFENDKLVNGQLKSKDGVYLGQFEQEKKSGRHYFHGKGLMKFASGDVYEGMWEDGQMEGYGFYFYAEDFEGSDSEEEEGLKDKKTRIKPEYEGIFEKGMRSEGTMRYSNGDTYIGLFDREGLKI